jgi:hypothetical protein
VAEVRTVTKTTESENKHMKIHKYPGLDVHHVDTEIAIAEDDRATAPGGSDSLNDSSENSVNAPFPIAVAESGFCKSVRLNF